MSIFAKTTVCVHAFAAMKPNGRIVTLGAEFRIKYEIKFIC
ncbi:hypothetical protein F320042A7_22640 [Blautia producta]